MAAPAQNTYDGNSKDVTRPARHAFAISTSDTDDVPFVTRGLYIGGAGDVSVDLVGGETAVVFVGLAAGVIHPLAVTRVRSTGTSATNIVGVY